MRNILNIFRSVVAVPVAAALIITLLVAGTAGVFALTVSDRDTPKQWLVEGNVYENLVSVAVLSLLNHIDQTTEQTDPDTADEVIQFEKIVSRDEIPAIAERVFSHAWIKEEVEGAIDGLYDFLEGKTAIPQVSVDIRPVRERGQTELAALFKRTLNELPSCVKGEGVANVEDFDLLRASCVPSHFNREELSSLIDREVQNVPLFAKDVITLSDTEIRTENLNNIRAVYPFFQYSFFAFVGLAIILSFILYILVPRRELKKKVTGVVWAVSGAVLLTFAGIGIVSFPLVFSIFVVPELQAANIAFLGALEPFAHAVYSGLLSKTLIFSLAVLLVGGVLWYSSRKQVTDNKEENNTHVERDAQ